jgi:hypothetical protein
MGVRALARGLGGIFTPLTMDVIHLLGPLVKGLKIAIAQGPSRRDAIEVNELLKILLTKPKVGSTVHLGGTTYKVMTARLKGFVVLIKPGIFGDIPALLEHLFRIPILGFLGQPISALQHQNLEARSGQVAGQGAPTGATADNHNVKMVPIRHLKLGALGQGRDRQ